ncbi:hypothetical protein FRC03_012916 [Tulasnella sp. 419]|nr:hypothetical protein FRC03_012916 [Tulasnella sp. 419]
MFGFTVSHSLITVILLFLASMFFKSCNCNSSIATRVGFAIILCINSIFAWLMKTPSMVKKLEEWTYGYLTMDCDGDDGKCYGLLAVHRICFALALFHVILSVALIGVKDTRSKRAAIQNGFWGPKVLLWWALVAMSFFIPNGFFMFYGNYISLIGASIFIILGLILLIDFAHSWSETCLHNWETSDSNLWQFILIGSTATLYAVAITLTGIMYGFFAGSECQLNRFFISFNLVLCIIITVLSVHPTVQDANPKSGLVQSSMVASYCTYLIMSAVGNRTSGSHCNPIHDRQPGSVDTTAKSTVVMGAIFTFLAVAYSTSRAATQSRALVGRKKKGAIALPVGDADGDESHHEIRRIVNTQPGKKDSPRYQALLAAVEAGAIPASALDEEDDDEDDEDVVAGEERDDERTGTKYNYSWFHIIFVMGTMYVGELLTDWHVVKSGTPPPSDPNPDDDVFIGRSAVAMWMRVVSSWVCILLYAWSLLAPVLMPDRFGDL